MKNFIFGTDIVKWYDYNRWFAERFTEYNKKVKFAQVEYEGEHYTTFIF